jgi:hypothetical protein
MIQADAFELSSPFPANQATHSGKQKTKVFFWGNVM